ncbi:MAG: hypothetical protein WC933_01755 [Candidatus Paceibacterota bacterium]|jgi:hypothetical protein
MKITFWEKLLQEIDSVSVDENQPTEKEVSGDTQMGTIRNDTTKKFFAYLKVLEREMSSIQNWMSIENDDTKRERLETEGNYLNEKITLVDIFLLLLMEEELGNQARCCFMVIKHGWVAVKPNCVECNEQFGCSIASKDPRATSSMFLERKLN